MDTASKLIDSLVPDLATETIIRRKRAPKHDFKDGNGRVFAHRHDNGGGWVADTAWVASSAKVTRSAQVFGFARVHDECAITGRAKVYGRARLFDNVKLEQDAIIADSALVRDTALLKDNSWVGGNANVLGSTQLRGHALVKGNAVVINSNISGPPKRSGCSRVTGNARLLNCRCWGYLRVRDTAVLENSNLHNAFIYESARLINSTVYTQWSYIYQQYLDNCATLAQLPVLIDDSVVKITGTLLNSNIQTPRWTMPSNLQFVNAILICGAGAEPALDEFCQSTLGNLSGPVVSVDARGQDAIRALVERLSNPAAQYVPAPVARAAIDVTAVHQRRIMRMEGT